MERSLVTQRTDGIHNQDTRTQREEVHFKRLHSLHAPAGCCLWAFERIFVARGKVEKKKTRRERVGGYFCGRGYYSLTDAVNRTIAPCFPGASSLALDKKRNFYALFYALIVRVATVVGLVMMNFLSPVFTG